jgi:hypothetical protein
MVIYGYIWLYMVIYGILLYPLAMPENMGLDIPAIRGR